MAEKGYKGQGMDGFFARFYDKNARENIMDQYRIWVKALKEIIPQNADLLEVAPGPGYLAIELAKAGIGNITGMDISGTFVDIAKRNALEAGVDIRFIQGNASQMPFENGEFTHVICTSAFKNFNDPRNALNEMHRILAPGGIVWLSDMRKDTSNRDIDDYVRHMMKLKGINGLITSLTFKYMLRNRAYTKESFLELVSKTPFTIRSFVQKEMEFQVILVK